MASSDPYAAYQTPADDPYAAYQNPVPTKGMFEQAGDMYKSAFSQAGHANNIENLLGVVGNIDTALGHGQFGDAWDAAKSLVPHPMNWAQTGYEKFHNNDMPGFAANLSPLMMLGMPTAVETTGAMIPEASTVTRYGRGAGGAVMGGLEAADKSHSSLPLAAAYELGKGHPWVAGALGLLKAPAVIRGMIKGWQDGVAPPMPPPPGVDPLTGPMADWNPAHRAHPIEYSTPAEQAAAAWKPSHSAHPLTWPAAAEEPLEDEAGVPGPTPDAPIQPVKGAKTKGPKGTTPEPSPITPVDTAPGQTPSPDAPIQPVQAASEVDNHPNVQRMKGYASARLDNLDAYVQAHNITDPNYFDKMTPAEITTFEQKVVKWGIENNRSGMPKKGKYDPRTEPEPPGGTYDLLKGRMQTRQGQQGKAPNASPTPWYFLGPKPPS